MSVSSVPLTNVETRSTLLPRGRQPFGIVTADGRAETISFVDYPATGSETHFSSLLLSWAGVNGFMR